MNCEPCNSLEITCNHNVTIGYLKELVAIIPDACCTKITVSGNDSYCPTYGELTNGSIIPYFSDGGTNAWSNNVDGITINGGYSNNQCVAKKDLKLIYTAFESLTVANSSPVVSECGGATTTTRTLTFRKYTKECDKASTSTTQTDTTLRVTWSGTDSSSTGTKTYSRNTSFSDTHASTVSCSISWRGCSHTSNSISVSQKVRAFDHNVDYSRSAGESVDVYCYPWDFDCDGGTSYASATYYYTTWTERHYIDTCGVDYNQENINYSYHNTHDVSEYLNATSHSYEKCTVTTASASRFNFTATYDGFSDSDYCQMECSGGCETCPPTDYTEYDDVTASCSDLSATVYGTAHTFSGGALDGEGKCTGYTETTASTSYYVSWSCDTSGGWVDNHVYVTDAPCCPAGCRYTYADVELGCDAKDSYTTSVAYTAVCTHEDGTSETTISANTVTIPTVTCNSGEARPIQDRVVADTLEAAKPKITQNGGCPCQAPCGCDNFAISPTSLEWEASSTTSKEVSITESGSCISGVQVSSSNSHFTASISGDKITVTPTAATSSSEETGTLTVSYKANGSDCTPSKTVPLKHKATTCTTTTCTCYVVGPATLKTGTSIASGATTAEVEWSYTAVTWTTASTCDVSSSTTTSTSSHTVTGIPTNNTCGSITRTDSFTWTGYKACDSSSACTNNDATVYWSVSQDRGKSPDDPECTGCYCSGFTLGSTPSSWNCDETDEREVSYTGDCHTDVAATSSNSHFTVTVDQTNKKIKVKPTGIYTGNTEERATITVTYKANGSSCDSQTFGVTHNSGTTCYCPDDCTSITAFSITKTSLEASGATSWVEIGSYGYNSACSDKVGVDSDKTWLSVKAENGTIYGKWDANTSFTDTRSATITAKWGTTSCTSRTGSTTQEKVTCNCTTANFNVDPTTMSRVYDDDNFYVQYTADCGSVSATVVSGSDWITGMTVNNDDVTFDITENTSTTSARTGSVKLFLVGNESCSASTTITQGKAPCNCTTANFNVDPTSFNVASGASSSVSNKFIWTANCGTVKVEVTSGSSWLSIDQDYTSSNYRYFIVTANNTASARTGTIDVYLDGAYSATCRSAVTVTQAEGSAPVTCYCSALTLSDTSVSVNAGASTSVTYSADCVSITSIAASSTGITIDTGTTGTIKITGNTSGNYTITIKSSANGTACTDKTISVTVGCGTIAISPKDSSGNCSGGTVNFSATYTP